jgi:hypothetical protein
MSHRSKFTQLPSQQHDNPTSHQPNIVTVRREWRPRLDPIDAIIDGLRPLQFHADHDELHVSTVNIFPIPGGIAINFVTTPGSINVVIPAGMVKNLCNGMVRLAPEYEAK